MDTLAQIFERHRVHGADVGHGDKGGTHSYIPEYERLLAPYRAGCTFLEIGLAMGLSLAMWREYFGRASRVVGVDLSIVFDRKPHEDANTWVIEADATQPELLEKIGPINLDVVIDDGSHLTADQVKTFNLLKPRMAPGGIYIIEDILCLEMCRAELENLHPKHEVIDLRHVKGRFDDVLVVYYF